jgi:cytochrome c biogenesis factor
LEPDSDIFSRDFLVSATVFSFAVLVVLVIIGMITPLLVKLTGGGEISLDSTYFNLRTAPLAFILVFLLCACLLAGAVKKNYMIATTIAVLLFSALFALIPPAGDWRLGIFIPPVTAALTAVLFRISRIVKTRSGPSLLKGLGAHVIHIGILLVIIGVVASSTMQTEDSAVLTQGIPGFFEGMQYTIQVQDMESGYTGTPYSYYPGSSYVTDVSFDIYKNGVYFDSGTLRYITDIKWQQTYTSTYINRGFFEELFIAPRALDETTGEVDLYIRVVPFITFVWAGILFMTAGMLILVSSLFLYRKKPEEAEA